MKPRELYFNSFDEAIAEIETLAGSGYQQAGVWCLGQMCEHLSLGLERTMEGKTFPVPLMAKLIGPLIKKGFFRSRKMRSGMTTASVLQPQNASDERHEVDRTIAAMRRFAAFPGPFPRHPIFGVLTTQEWRHLELIHAAHHLQHLIPNQAVAV